MVDGSRIQRLVEEILDSGRAPEEVCGGEPEVLAEVCLRLQQARALDAELSAMFPAIHAEPALEAPWSSELPRIPGYQIESVLGRGGMGVVYRARHLGLNRFVAIKMLLAGAHAGRNELLRFRREVESIAGLRHPNIVLVYDVGELGGQPYFTMELVPGGTLAAHLDGNPQPIDEAVTLLRKLAEATQAAHDSGVVHRDLKPSNILLDVDGTPKISDFGLARRIDDDSVHTLTGARLGTPRYMAPEQALGRQSQIGPAVDVYALGVLLYELMTGRPPFCGESAAETERQVISDEPLSPSRLNRRIPRDLETICLKCLSKEPDRRYATARALADDLRRMQEGLPITARRIGVGGQAMRWIRRKPTAAALLLTVLLLAGLLLYIAAGAWSRAAAQRVELARWSARIELVQTLQNQGRFAEARAILARLPDAGSTDLRRRIERAEREVALVEQLDRIRLDRGFSEQADRFDGTADAAYERAFGEVGVAIFAGAPEAVAQQLRDTDVRSALVSALDDWTLCVRDKGRLSRLLAVARLADPDPWRDQVREPALWDDPVALRTLAASAQADNQPVPLLLVLAGLLADAGAQAELLRRVQVAHPNHFWVNMTLAEVLPPGEQAIGFFRAALAARPDALPAQVNLSIALDALGRSEEALAVWRHAQRTHPDSALASLNLAIQCLKLDRLEEAEEQVRSSIALNPQFAEAYAVLGSVLLRQARFAEAAEACRGALGRLPVDSAAWQICQADQRRAEAQLALLERLPAILDRSAVPANAAERLQFARLLYTLGRWSESAGFFAVAFAERPDFAAALESHDRYLAACAAALAGCDARDERALVEDERARLRRQAVDWLREDLLGWTAHAGQGDEARARVQSALLHWQVDPDLAGLRDPYRLPALPAAERDACIALWQEVAALVEVTRRAG